MPNQARYTLKKLFSGFTLVELIVVISVLAILATIAITQVGNVTSNARDSQRLTNFSAIKSALELYATKQDAYPTPSNATSVTYSGATAWVQGTFGDSVVDELKTLSPKPIDPLYGKEYIYSLTADGREFEIGGVLEKSTSYLPSLFRHVLADTQNITSIKGNYNGIALKVSVGSKVYVVAAPTIIAGTLGTTLETTSVVLPQFGSLPVGFSGAVVSSAQTGTFTPTPVWEGASLPENLSQVTAMVAGLQNAYSGTLATNLSQIASLIKATGNEMARFGQGIVEGSLGGKPIQQIDYCDNPTVVRTFAGSYAPATLGFLDGNGLNARFYYVRAITITPNGNLYVADRSNHAIRKITPEGDVTTIAGSYPTRAAGFVDGTGTGARFNTPIGITLDPSGNLYVGDTINHAIRKITPAGVVSTLAGSSASGFVDGVGAAARFYEPRGVVADAGGNVFVSDTNNHAIRKITPNGTVTTFAGNGVAGFLDGTGTAARFYHPYGLAVDLSGNLYVADSSNSAIRKITPDGTVTTLAGAYPTRTAGFVDGTGTAARFHTVAGVTFDANGNMYISDFGNHAIRKMTKEGVVTTIAGNGVAGFLDGVGTASQFTNPTEAVVDAGGNLYVAEYGNHVVRKISCY